MHCAFDHDLTYDKVPTGTHSTDTSDPLIELNQNDMSSISADVNYLSQLECFYHMAIELTVAVANMKKGHLLISNYYRLQNHFRYMAIHACT